MGTMLDDELIEIDNDVKWLHINYNDFINRYDGDFVAIKNQSVIDHDKQLDNLKEILERKGIKLSEVLIEFIRDKTNQIH
jgi:hypothetical protein